VQAVSESRLAKSHCRQTHRNQKRTGPLTPMYASTKKKQRRAGQGQQDRLVPGLAYMRVCRRSQPHQLNTAHYAGATLRHLDTLEVVCNRLYTPEVIIPRLFMHSNDTKAPQLPRRCLEPAANNQPNDSDVCTLAICLHICLRICLCRCVHNTCTVRKGMHFDTA
jgi:hypothetical protein